MYAGTIDWLPVCILYHGGGSLKMHIGEHQESLTLTFIVCYYFTNKILPFQLICRQPERKEQPVCFYIP